MTLFYIVLQSYITNMDRRSLMASKSYRIDDKSTSDTIIDSEEFSGLHYQIKDGHVILIGGSCGTFAVSLKNAATFISELKEVVEMYA